MGAPSNAAPRETRSVHAGVDRIDVIDKDGVRIGWVDPLTGTRTLLSPDRAGDFDEMVDFWLSAAGLHDDAEGSAPSECSPLMKVTEIRYPDAHIVRSLIIPMLRCG